MMHINKPKLRNMIGQVLYEDNYVQCSEGERIRINQLVELFVMLDKDKRGEGR